MADSPAMDAADVVKRADEADLRLVRFLWCGNDGTVRAKASSRHGLEGRIRAGIGLTVAMNAMNALDRVQPYAPHTGAMLVDQLALDGAVAPVDQRGFLRRMTGRLAERGARLEVAFENEFALAAQDDEGAYVPLD